MTIGSDPESLATIAAPGVALSIWSRPAPVPIVAADLQDFASLRIETSVTAVASALEAALAQSPKPAWYQPIVTDITHLAERFAAVMEVDDVEIRLECVTGNSCWKFHADYVRARLITTYCGRGTEWAVQDATLGPPRHMQAGDVSIFKGRIWMPMPRILHRSPPIADTGEIRLLLVIDPLPKG
ncbi:DUF1826 domain-containing protein [Sphingomonas sp. ASY06-1R]|uniref:DUF1826 domain-containing protein n=1 Tax=Sphingomonas sp. ASY06-1R TaxID=3445771 RepID=UPI003FA20280